MMTVTVNMTIWSRQAWGRMNRRDMKISFRCVSGRIHNGTLLYYIVKYIFIKHYERKVPTISFSHNFLRFTVLNDHSAFKDAW